MQYDSSNIEWQYIHRHGKIKLNQSKGFKKPLAKEHGNVKIAETDFYVSAICPFLGASPNGLVSCSYHPDRVLEIKNPFKYQHGLKAQGLFNHKQHGNEGWSLILQSNLVANASLWQCL